jgi:hypothetical protein
LTSACYFRPNFPTAPIRHEHGLSSIFH